MAIYNNDICIDGVEGGAAPSINNSPPCGRDWGWAYLFLLFPFLLTGCLSHQALPPYTAYPVAPDNVTSLIQPYSGRSHLITVETQAAFDAKSAELFKQGYLGIGETEFRSRETLLSCPACEIARMQGEETEADIILLQRTVAPYSLHSSLIRPEKCHVLYFRRATPPVLGVSVGDASPNWRDQHGVKNAVLVYLVMDRTPAANIGIQKGDIIVQLDETPVGWSQDFRPLVHSFAGKSCKLTFYHGEEKRVVDVAMGK